MTSPTFTFAGNGIGDNHGRFIKLGFRLAYRAVNVGEVMPVHFYHMPVERLPLIGQGLKRHDVFRKAIYLDVVAVNNRDEIAELLFSGKHCAFPTISRVKLAV